MIGQLALEHEAHILAYPPAEQQGELVRKLDFAGVGRALTRLVLTVRLLVANLEEDAPVQNGRQRQGVARDRGLRTHQGEAGRLECAAIRRERRVLLEVTRGARHAGLTRIRRQGVTGRGSYRGHRARTGQQQ